MHQGPSAGPNGPPMPLNLRRNVIQHASASSSLHLPEGTKADAAKALVAEIHPAHLALMLDLPQLHHLVWNFFAEEVRL
eukprot:Skav214953  [mRNA]  locus=scaffold2320:95470:95719:- [translate_table: standard]